MRKLKSVIDGLPDRSTGGNGLVASGRNAPIEIDELLPIDEDPKAYLERRVAFYIALLEELIRRGADRGDIYFMKDCVDALLKMTTIGRAKTDINLTGGLSKLRDEIDFSNMSKEELEEFVSKAKGEANGRDDDRMGSPRALIDVSGSVDVIEERPRKRGKRNKGPRRDGGSGGEADAASTREVVESPNSESIDSPSDDPVSHPG